MGAYVLVEVNKTTHSVYALYEHGARCGAGWTVK